MKMRMAVAMAALAIGAAATTLRAGPVDPKYIPLDAKWVAHIDVDAVAKSKLLGMLNIDLKLTGNEKHFLVGARPEGMSDDDVKRIAAIQDALGMKFPDDLHGLTLVGHSFDGEGVVLIVKAKVDKDRLIGLAKVSPAYKSVTYHDIEVSNWRPDKDSDDEDGVSGAFLTDDVLVLGRTIKEIQHVIDTMPDKKSNRALELLGKPSAANGAVMVYMAGEGLAELQQEAELSPVIAPIQTVRASIGEQGEDVVLKAEATVKTAEAARQVRGALEGIRALVTLATIDDKPDKETRKLADLTSRATVAVDEKTVTVVWPVAMTKIRDLIGEDSDPKQHNAATRKTAGAPSTQRAPAAK